MSYTAWSVVFGEQPTAAKWNQLGANDAGFKDGTNIDDNAIIARHIGAGEVTAVKRSQVIASGIYSVTSTGNKSITGLGFRPKAVMFWPQYTAGVSAGQNTPACVGYMDASSQWAYGATTRNGNGGSVRKATNRCFLLATVAAGGGSDSINIDAAYVSLDADGFTFNVTTHNNTIDVAWVAFA